MEGLGLLVGHLLGDYILQDDWQAANKTTPHPGSEPVFTGMDSDKDGYIRAHWDWNGRRQAYRRGHVACFVHCSFYTLAVWGCSFWWMPWWGLAVCWLAHFPVDRWRMARRWMNLRQEAFATGVFSPWSIIVVDNTFHLLVLFVIGVCGGPRS